MIDFQKTETGFFLRVHKDQKLNDSLGKFAVQHKIPSGFFVGLGALKNCELGFYHLDKKAYDRKLFTPEAELLNLTGNISWLENQPVVHSHVTLGNDQFQAYGGHLFEADVAVTVEIHISVFESHTQRVWDPNIGLNLLSFCKIDSKS